MELHCSVSQIRILLCRLWSEVPCVASVLWLFT
uniref:Uncharacterized protein n=1 Tax=Anguilla anguilla TaxID=7936 RepID=A0A0E9W5K4_ANGAN